MSLDSMYFFEEGNDKPEEWWATIPQRIRNKIQVAASGCWEWRGCLTPKGYGQLRSPEGKTRFAHRWIYEQCFSPVPAGKMLDHQCRNRKCVNPRHLRAVTNAENLATADWSNNRQRQTSKMRCPHGHPYSIENTYVCKNRYRHCIACTPLRTNQYRVTEEYRAKRKARGY